MPSRMWMYLAGAMLMLAAMAVGQDAAVKPVMDSAGKISFGSKSIWMKPGYSQLEMVIDDTVAIFATSIFNFGPGDTSPCFFPNKQIEIKDNTITYVSDMVAGRGQEDFLGKYSLSLSLQKDNLIKISSQSKLNPGVKLVNSYFYMDCVQELSGYYNAGGRKNELNPPQGVKLEAQPEMSFTFFPEDPARKFRIIPAIYSEASVSAGKGMISFQPQDGRLELLLDLSGEKEFTRSSEYYGGTDFEKIDRLHLPQYKLCRNLIQNPSFEAGLRYYGYKSFGVISPFENSHVYNIDNQHAAFGKNSLRIRALKDPNTLQLATFAVPVEPGKKYIFSFYAKGSLPEGLFMDINGRATATHWLFADRKARYLSVTNVWQRYDVSFTPIEEFYTIFLQGGLVKNARELEGAIWLDGLQLEEEKLTDYTEGPFSLQLTSASRGNCLDFRQKPDFKFILKAKPEQHGSLELTVEDFAFKKIFEGKYEFNTGTNGEIVISLADLDKQVLNNKARGVFAVKAILAFDGGKEACRDYFRFAVMTPLQGKHKNKNIFCIAPGTATSVLCSEGLDRRLARLRDVGFGSAVYVENQDREIEKQLFSKLKEYDFADVGCAVIDKRANGGEIREDNLAMTNLCAMVNAPPEKMKEYEAICEAKARNRPWISTWFFAGEIEGMQPLVSDPKSLGALIVATLKGIKKGNPVAKVHMGGTPWNIDENGRKWAAEYIKAVTEADPSVKFDGTAIHIYREMPESPDLDAATAAYIEMLKRYGYDDKPIYWDEGMNYFEYFIPGKGMTPYHGNSGDKWYPGMLTYDMGRAERIAAAFSARTWLVALKYMKNIACLHDWSTRRYFWDQDLTIGAKLKVVNTMGRILGDADFYKDIRFAPDCRCYMFIDQKQRPIAVIWGHDRAVDRWEKPAPVFNFNFAGQKLEFLDLMETEQTFPASNGITPIPASPFPLFIIGAPGTGDKLAEAIAGGVNMLGSQLPVKMSAMPLNAEKAELRFASDLTSTLKAEASVTLNSVSNKYSLEFAPHDVLVESVKMLPTVEILKKFRCSASVSSGKYPDKQENIDGAFTCLPSGQGIVIDGQPEDWKAIPAITLAPGIDVKCAVGGNTLYVAAQVNSAGSGAQAAVIVNAGPNDRDWTDFKTKAQDLYVYEMLPGTNGALTAFCHYVPSVQADSGPWTPKAGRLDARIAGRVEKSPDGDFIEMAFPAASLMPLNLSKGEKFGLNIVLKKDGATWSLAPVKNYQNAKEPGVLKLVLGFVE